MEYSFTVTQKQRLIELDISNDIDSQTFDSKEEREHAFREIQRKLVDKNRERLNQLRDKTLRPAIRKLESVLIKKLYRAGFVEVVTPTTLSRGMQVKWVSRKGIHFKSRFIG